MKTASGSAADRAYALALYYFARLQVPSLTLSAVQVRDHLQRTFGLYRSKNGNGATWDHYWDRFYPLDWCLAVGCLEGREAAWKLLFAAHAGRSDCLLVDALRARAVRLYPRDEGRQEQAVADFWGHLLVSETPGSVPILARFDGQRPLVPWLIRVFQNWHVSQLRHRAGVQPFPEEDVPLPLPAAGDSRWHEAFCVAAREAIGRLSEAELLILGLRLRYRMSQREVATVLGVHEGTVSRQTSHLRDRLLDEVSAELLAQGWGGDDLVGFVRTELGNLLLDEPRLSAANLATLLGARGKKPTTLPKKGP